MKYIVLALSLVSVLAVAACVQTLDYTGMNRTSQPNQPGQSGQSPSAAIDDRDVGGLRHELLQQSHPNIIIEIDYASGKEPTAAAKRKLESFFAGFGKSVAFSGGNVITETKGSHTVADLMALEEKNRQHYTGSGTAAIHIMFLNGDFEGGGALGVAYKASSAAVFPDRINEATTALVLYSQIEEAVTMHELGHLLGLVNIGYRSGRDHEDAGHPHHSRNDGSVMYWAVEDISVRNLLRLGPSSEFDEDDTFDLQKIREGAY